MIPSATLAAWLADIGAQRASRDRCRNFSDRWSVAPIFGALHGELTRLETPDPAAIIDQARRFFDQSGAADAVMQALMAEMREDPMFLPTFPAMASEIHWGLLLFQHPLLSIGLGVTGVDQLAAKKAHPRGGGSVGFTGTWNLYRYVKAGEAVVAYWEAPPITAGFHKAEAGQCRLTGRGRLADGDEILIDGRSQSFIIEHATGDMVYLQAQVHAGAAPVVAEYDAVTRSLVGATSGDEASSRLQMMATLLRTMDREDAVPVLRETLGTSHFFTRWHIMRELLALDAQAAYPELRRMAEADPHPEIRIAARQTLAMFFADEEAAIVEGSIACRA